MSLLIAESLVNPSFVYPPPTSSTAPMTRPNMNDSSCCVACCVAAFLWPADNDIESESRIASEVNPLFFIFISSSSNHAFRKPEALLACQLALFDVHVLELAGLEDFATLQ